MILLGLERLLETCTRLSLSLETKPPVPHPPAAGTLISGHPLDPMLAALHGRLGDASFAAHEAGLIIDGTDELAERNQHWKESWQAELALPLFVFGGEPLLAHDYATVPGLADGQGCQPVVKVNTYEEPFALPVASNVDRFLDLYARYLEKLVVSPSYEEEGANALLFPWDVHHLLASDERLVELIREGRFDPVMKKTGSTPEWVEQILSSAR